MVEGIRDDDSMSIIIDRNACWKVELAGSRSSGSPDREQEREIDRRQEHQSMVERIDNDDAAMMLVDRNASRAEKLKARRSTMADARQDRLVAQRP